MENKESLTQIIADLEEVGFQLSGMTKLMKILEEHDIHQGDMYRLLRADFQRLDDMVMTSADRLREISSQEK